MKLYKIDPPPLSVLMIFMATLTVIITSYRASAQTEEYYNCRNTTFFSSNSSYQTNLDHLLSWLSTNSTRQNGFYYAAAGNSDSTVYGAFLCRGDLTPDACHDCASVAAKQILRRCPLDKKSVIWFNECMLRYSDEPFSSVSEEAPRLILMNTAASLNQSSFMSLLAETINAAETQAVKGGADKKFATKEAKFSTFQTLYTLAQCTPDLTETTCETCLKRASSTLPSCCNGKIGARVLQTSCIVRYETYPFYQSSPVITSREPTPKGICGESCALLFDFSHLLVLSTLSGNILETDRPINLSRKNPDLCSRSPRDCGSNYDCFAAFPPSLLVRNKKGKQEAHISAAS